MEQTLKVTNVLSDPTRFNIYQFMIQHQKELTVIEVAEQFNIHPNVARMHLTKLADINLVFSYTEKSGKGGRPSRLYRLSEEVIELNFPHRDYKLFSIIALETFAELGEVGKQALYDTGKKYGRRIMNRYDVTAFMDFTVEQKIQVLEDASIMMGMYPQFDYNPTTNQITFKVNNCPFKEIAINNQTVVCKMHKYFIRGMFETLFTDIELIETNNMFLGCENCTYVAKLSPLS